jgi:TonB family protein
VRQPTPPPLPAVTKPPVADAPPPVETPALSQSDLPRGTFTYPVQRKKSGVLLKLLALACAAGLGFVAVVYVLPMFMTKREPAKVQTAQASAPPVETPPVETPAEGPGSDVAEAPPEEVPVETPTEEPAEKPTPKPSHRPARPVRAAGAQTSKPDDSPDVEPTPKPVKQVEAPIVDDGCDETSCILSKYEKACCEKYKPKTSDLSTRTGAGVPENLDKMMVRDGVAKVKPRVIKCGEKAGVKGEVRISMTVSPAGAVTSAAVASSPDAGLGACVLAAMQDARFGKSVNGGTFTYPFVF